MRELGIAPDLSQIKTAYHNTVNNVLAEAGIDVSEIKQRYAQGKNGRHTEHMGYILGELQYMQRTYPNMQW